jgi:hypothetical protein
VHSSFKVSSTFNFHTLPSNRLFRILTNQPSSSTFHHNCATFNIVIASCTLHTTPTTRMLACNNNNIGVYTKAYHKHVCKHVHIQTQVCKVQTICKHDDPWANQNASSCSLDTFGWPYQGWPKSHDTTFLLKNSTMKLVATSWPWINFCTGICFHKGMAIATTTYCFSYGSPWHIISPWHFNVT